MTSSDRPARVRIMGVGDLDVVGAVLCHELVTGNAVGDGVHDRPLRRGELPAALRFFLRKFHRRPAADVHVKRFILHVDA